MMKTRITNKKRSKMEIMRRASIPSKRGKKRTIRRNPQRKVVTKRRVWRRRRKRSSTR
jgi:hypothetical protein